MKKQKELTKPCSNINFRLFYLYIKILKYNVIDNEESMILTYFHVDKYQVFNDGFMTKQMFFYFVDSWMTVIKEIHKK